MKGIYKKGYGKPKKKDGLLKILKKSDIKFLKWYSMFALLVTLVYWANGGKSIFVFPTILCVGLVVRNLRKPASKYFNNGSRVLPIKHNKTSRT